MEFSEIWGFFKILSESIKIYLKNVKLIASITALSLLLSSILFLLFDFSYQFATTYMTNSVTDDYTSAVIPILQILISMALIFAVQLTFFKAYIAIGHATGIATTITAAASHTDSKLSLPDLISAVKTNWNTPPLKSNLRRSVNPLSLLCIIAVAVAVPVVIFYPNPLTITIVSVGGVAIFVIQLYESVVPALAAVIPLVEAGCEAAEAAEKAERLVEGQRVHGFMVNLFVNAVGVIVCLGFWMIVGDKDKFNMTVYGLFFVDVALILRIVLGVVYTVYYFRCKEYHAEQIQQPFENFNYTKLINDIP